MLLDFGFIIDSSPGGDLGFERAPFKVPCFAMVGDLALIVPQMTDEYLNIMGGSRNGPYFNEFKELCVQAYLAIRLVVCVANIV